MITPDDMTRLRMLAGHGQGGLAVGVTAAEVAALLDCVDLLRRLRRYEYLVASDYRAHTGRSLADDLDRLLGQG